MIKRNTIHFRLFLIYSIFIVTVITIIVSLFSIYMSGFLERNVSESLRQFSGNISSQLDGELKRMNVLSKNIIFSSTLKKMFFSDLSNNDPVTLSNRRQFIDTIYSIVGPNFDIVQITMFSDKGLYVSSSKLSAFSLPLVDYQEVFKENWVQNTLERDGKSYIVLPHKDSWGYSKRPVFSLCRAFSSEWNLNVDSILEIQQDYDIIDNIVTSSFIQEETEPDYKNPEVYIYDANGQLVYPYRIDGSNTEQELNETYGSSRNYYDSIKDKALSTNSDIIIKPTGSDNHIIAYTTSGFSNWTVVVVETSENLLKPVNRVKMIILSFGLLIALLTLIISYFVSKSLVKPIKRLHLAIKNLILEKINVDANDYVHSNFNEIEELNYAFIDMCNRLQNSLDEVVRSKSSEIHAHLLALRTQVNPHFLYNNLATISALAEDAGLQDIVDMCKYLTESLRYIGDSTQNNIEIRDEIMHIERHLNIIKIKYKENIKINMQIPENILDIKIPKLIIEPVVENSIKHGLMKIEPPWEININGYCVKNRWFIRIRDNGAGFEDNQLEALIDKLASINPKTEVHNLKIGGLGIINTYVRLKLQYDDQAVFKIFNHSEGGAVIIIGGCIKNKD